MRRFATVLLATGGVLMATAPNALAASPPIVGPHQHFITTPGGTHEVGPPRCENAATAQGFSGYHHNIHVGTPNTDAFTNENNPVAVTATRCP